MKAQFKPRGRRWPRALASLLPAVGLLLALAPQAAPVRAVGLVGSLPHAPAPTTAAALAMEASPNSPAAAEIDCNKPLPGKWARLFAEEEIVVACRSESNQRLE